MEARGVFLLPGIFRGHLLSRQIASEDKNDNIELVVSWSKEGGYCEKQHRFGMALYLKIGGL